MTNTSNSRAYRTIALSWYKIVVELNTNLSPAQWTLQMLLVPRNTPVCETLEISDPLGRRDTVLIQQWLMRLVNTGKITLLQRDEFSIFISESITQITAEIQTPQLTL